jgi:hypothetical protein
MKTPCRSYRAWEDFLFAAFKGNKECEWYKGTRLACTKPRGKYSGKECPWCGRPAVGR